jgi:dephospho-CoA kinase
MKKVNNDRSDLIIIEGIRRTYDLAAFQFLPNFSLIALQADPEIRYQRLLARNQNHGDQLKTYDEFLVDQESEPEREIDKVISSAKYIIRNDGSIQELYQQLNLKLEIIFAH